MAYAPAGPLPLTAAAAAAAAYQWEEGCSDQWSSRSAPDFYAFSDRLTGASGQWQGQLVFLDLSAAGAVVEAKGACPRPVLRRQRG